MQDVIAKQGSIFLPARYPRDEPVTQILTEMAERYPRYGFKKLFQVQHRQGHS
ncbi:Uncharacterised protein [Serratia proteamaculans]|nr:Uncharacterised protein [Serratia proteamaculans]